MPVALSTRHEAAKGVDGADRRDDSRRCQGLVAHDHAEDRPARLIAHERRDFRAHKHGPSRCFNGGHEAGGEL